MARPLKKSSELKPNTSPTARAGRSDEWRALTSSEIASLQQDKRERRVRIAAIADRLYGPGPSQPRAPGEAALRSEGEEGEEAPADSYEEGMRADKRRSVADLKALWLESEANSSRAD